MKALVAGKSRSIAKRASARKGSTEPAAQTILDAHLSEHLDPERRRVMVAEAAYFFAEHRGFEPGHELEDWLAAEDQIEATLRLSDLTTAALLRHQEGGR